MYFHGISFLEDDLKSPLQAYLTFTKAKHKNPHRHQVHGYRLATWGSERLSKYVHSLTARVVEQMVRASPQMRWSDLGPL
jgi:hypothetical protein